MKIKIIKIFALILFSINLSANTIKLSSDCEILTVDSTKISQHAARELKKYLDKIFGKPTKIVVAIDNTKLTFILAKKRSQYSKKLSFYHEISSLKEDGFIIKSKDGNIIIVGENDRALYYGVYHFLEKYLGCKFLSNDFEFIPKNKQIVLDPIYDKEMPYFSYREYFSNESDDLEFATKCRLNGRLGHRSSDEYQDDFFPKGKAIYNQFVPHELINDEQYECNGQYDFSLNKVSKLALDSVKSKLSKLDMLPNDYISLEHEDRNSFCSNGLINTDESGKFFLKYSSYIAENIKDTSVLYQAYQWTRKPPDKLKKLPENLTIFFSPIEADFSNTLNSSKNKAIFDDLKSWNRFDNDIFIWHYVTNFGAYFQPFPNIYALDKDIKLFSTLKNVRGVFLQSSYGTFAGELNDLRTWVFSKLLWSPDANIHGLIREFCDIYYGDASGNVQKYIRKLHKIHKSIGEKLLLKNSINSKFLQQESLKYLEEILDEGLMKVNRDNVSKLHLLKLYSGIDYVRVMRGDNDENLQKSKKRFKHFLSSHEGIEYFAEGSKIENIKQIIDIKRKISSPPVETKGLKEGVDWFEFQEYSLKLCCTDLVADANSSDGVSAKMRGEQSDWGYQLDIYNFPKGKWDIYASVKVLKKDSITILDNAKPVIHYGIYPTYIKGVSFLGQFENNRYKTIKIGSIDIENSNAQLIWLSPAGNKLIKSLYVDRLWIVKSKM